jgi:DSF synthase
MIAQTTLTNPPVGVADITFTFSTQLRARFEPGLGAMWLYWKPEPRACFNEPLLTACNDFAVFMKATQGVIEHQGITYPIRSCVLASDAQGVFNLGGDLNLFGGLITAKDKDGLTRYGTACVDAVFNNYLGYDLPITTISLVQGKCLGGGFEAALSSHVVIAERSAEFGFPEVIFNLFPGMGAASFLVRRATGKTAETLTTSGDMYSAEHLFALGVIDVLVEDGEGPAAVNHYLRLREPRMHNAFQIRKRIHPLVRAELDDIVALWVSTALMINPRDLRLMNMLVARQGKLATSGE